MSCLVNLPFVPRNSAKTCETNQIQLFIKLLEVPMDNMNKSCVLIGYPLGRHDGLILPVPDCPFCSSTRKTLHGIDLQSLQFLDNVDSGVKNRMKTVKRKKT